MTFARFTLAYWCVFIAALLPIVCAGIAKSGQFRRTRKEGGYDNHDPRAWLAHQSGWRARANAAQQNSFEALPFFIGAVIVAHQLAAPQARLDLMAFAYVFLRLIYIMAYVSDMAKARSAVWTLAFLLNVGIFFVGYR